MINFKKTMSTILMATTICCNSFIPEFSFGASFVKYQYPLNENLKIQTLFSNKTNENDGVIRIPTNPNDGVIRIQTVFVNPASKLLIDGSGKNILGYNINGNNYYHLRSLADGLRDTTGRFNIEYDSNNDKINVYTGYNYTGDTNHNFPTVEDLDADLKSMDYHLVVNGIEITIPIYKIKGVTFVNIQELSEHLGFKLNYSSETNEINLDTTSSICSDIKDKIYNPQFTYDPFTKIELSLEDINTILENSYLKDCGEYFYNMQEEYGVNVIYAMAVAFVESGRGKYPCGSYNYFGMIGNNYSSKQEGINAFGKLMNKSMYYGKSIEKIAPIYCNSAWASSIKSMMNEIWSYI